VTRNSQIQFENNEFGGRLKYFDRPSAPEFWDDQWTELESKIDYGKYESGYMPPFLRRTFLRWVPRGGRVLEAGCGLGRFTVAAHALGYVAEGVDYAPRVIERLQARYPHVRFFVGDVTALTGTPSATYEAVYSPGVCEHFEAGPEPVLAETYRVLKPGGYALVHCPCFNFVRRLLVGLGEFRGVPDGVFYQYAFSRIELRRRLERIGFDVVAMEPFDVITTFRDHLTVAGQLFATTLGQRIARVLERTPMVRRGGHCLMWVGRKRP
jgi:SAM-dependent methyltransferase